MGFLNCSDTPGKKCVLAQNAGVEGGELGKLKETFGKFSTYALLDLMEAHSPRSKDKLARSCKASSVIVSTIKEILRDRGLQK